MYSLNMNILGSTCITEDRAVLVVHLSLKPVHLLVLYFNILTHLWLLLSFGFGRDLLNMAEICQFDQHSSPLYVSQRDRDR